MSHRRNYFRGEWTDHRVVLKNGYVVLTGMYGHPLVTSGGIVGEHRFVLYEKIGIGPHYCHWNCGKLLEWTRYSLHVDHIDGNPSNNDPENLVPSCLSCNLARARAGNPKVWSSYKY